MSLYDKLNADIKQAMLDKNNVKRDCLRSVLSDIKNKTINAGKEITDEACLASFKSACKQHEDSIENFRKGNREDLVVKEQAELNYLNVYLPKMLSEDDTRTVIENMLKTIEPVKKNMGQIMKALPSDVDRKIASKILGTYLK